MLWVTSSSFMIFSVSPTFTVNDATEKVLSFCVTSKSAADAGRDARTMAGTRKRTCARAARRVNTPKARRSLAT